MCQFYRINLLDSVDMKKFVTGFILMVLAAIVAGVYATRQSSPQKAEVPRSNSTNAVPAVHIEDKRQETNPVARALQVEAALKEANRKINRDALRGLLRSSLALVKKNIPYSDTEKAADILMEIAELKTKLDYSHASVSRNDKGNLVVKVEAYPEEGRALKDRWLADLKASVSENSYVEIVENIDNLIDARMRWFGLYNQVIEIQNDSKVAGMYRISYELFNPWPGGVPPASYLDRVARASGSYILTLDEPFASDSDFLVSLIFREDGIPNIKLPQ